MARLISPDFRLLCIITLVFLDDGFGAGPSRNDANDTRANIIDVAGAYTSENVRRHEVTNLGGAYLLGAALGGQMNAVNGW